MLTATYALVALSVEQSSVRSSVSALKKNVDSYLCCQQEGDEVRVKYLLKKITQLHHWSQWRKIDIFLIPEIRKATKKADQLLAELESLSLLGLNIFRSIRNRLSLAIAQHSEKWEGMSGAIELYCNTLLKKLEKEEQELFPMARTEIPPREWFSIAENFLKHDARKKDHLRLLNSRMLKPVAANNVVSLEVAAQLQARSLPIFPQEIMLDRVSMGSVNNARSLKMVCARL